MPMARILIIEDNVDNMSLMRILMERENYQVITAYDGRDGLQVIREQHPDLILLDLDMPVVDGWGVIDQVKADPALQNIPIVVVSAHFLPGDDRRVFEAGCAAFVAKPFKILDLMDEIRRVLDLRGLPTAG